MSIRTDGLSRLVEVANQRGLEITPESVGLHSSFDGQQDPPGIVTDAPRQAEPPRVDPTTEGEAGAQSPSTDNGQPAPSEPEAQTPPQQSSWASQQPWQAQPPAQVQPDPAISHLTQTVSHLTQTIQAQQVNDFRERLSQLPPEQQQQVIERLERMAIEEEHTAAQQQLSQHIAEKENIARVLSIVTLSQRYGVPQQELAQFNDPHEALQYAEQQFQARNQRMEAARQARAAAGQAPQPHPAAIQPNMNAVPQGRAFDAARAGAQQPQPQGSAPRGGAVRPGSHPAQHQFEGGGNPSRPAQGEKPKTMSEARAFLSSQDLPVINQF